MIFISTSRLTIPVLTYITSYISSGIVITFMTTHYHQFIPNQIIPQVLIIDYS
jgi:hypothetical protein